MDLLMALAKKKLSKAAKEPSPYDDAFDEFMHALDRKDRDGARSAFKSVVRICQSQEPENHEDEEGTEE